MWSHQQFSEDQLIICDLFIIQFQTWLCISYFASSHWVLNLLSEGCWRQWIVPLRPADANIVWNYIILVDEVFLFRVGNAETIVANYVWSFLFEWALHAEILKILKICWVFWLSYELSFILCYPFLVTFILTYEILQARLLVPDTVLQQIRSLNSLDLRLFKYAEGIYAKQNERMHELVATVSYYLGEIPHTILFASTYIPFSDMLLDVQLG